MNSTRKAWDHGGRTTTERGYGAEHQRIRAELMRDVIFCEECSKHSGARRFTLGTVADHKISLAKGGSGDRSNYQLLCRDHADAKDARDRGKPVRVKRRIGFSGWPDCAA